MVDHIPAAAVLLQADGTIAYLNDLAVRLFSGGRANLIGSSLLAHLDSSSHEPFLQHISRSDPEQIEVTLADSGRSLLVRSAPVENGRCAIFMDVTHYVMRESELENARIAAERVARSKSDFLARLSHEIRSALASMIGFAEMLRDSMGGGDRELADIITRSGRHILDTLNSVMDLARLEFSRADLNLEEIDLIERVRDRVSMFRPRLRDRKVTLAFHAEKEQVPARVNPTFVDRIVHNLIDNAIKYTPAGEVNVTVTGDEGKACIYVTDTGVGIDEKFMPRLFAPFERERQEEDMVEEGVGLGLAITKYLVEMMDGKISARSIKGEGSTFSVSFPSPVREDREEGG